MKQYECARIYQECNTNDCNANYEICKKNNMICSKLHYWQPQQTSWLEKEKLSKRIDLMIRGANSLNYEYYLDLKKILPKVIELEKAIEQLELKINDLETDYNLKCARYKELQKAIEEKDQEILENSNYKVLYTNTIKQVIKIVSYFQDNPETIELKVGDDILEKIIEKLKQKPKIDDRAIQWLKDIDKCKRFLEWDKNNAKILLKQLNIE